MCVRKSVTDGLAVLAPVSAVLGSIDVLGVSSISQVGCLHFGGAITTPPYFIADGGGEVLFSTLVVRHTTVLELSVFAQAHAEARAQRPAPA